MRALTRFLSRLQRWPLFLNGYLGLHPRAILSRSFAAAVARKPAPSALILIQGASMSELLVFA
jgi:hypothetical protein